MYQPAYHYFQVTPMKLLPMLSAWASYQIRKIAGCACAGNAGNVFPRRRFQRKPLVSDPGMHHGTCVTHVPWCMSGLRTRGGGENVPGIPGACAPAISRIWQEAHAMDIHIFIPVLTLMILVLRELCHCYYLSVWDAMLADIFDLEKTSYCFGWQSSSKLLYGLPCASLDEM